MKLMKKGSFARDFAAVVLVSAVLTPILLLFVAMISQQKWGHERLGQAVVAVGFIVMLVITAPIVNWLVDRNHRSPT